MAVLCYGGLNETPFLALALAVLATPAGAEHCIRPTEAIEWVLRNDAGSYVMGHFTGGAAQVFVTAFNEYPPPTDYESNEVILFAKPAISTVFIVLFNDSCVVARGDMTMSAARRLIEQVMNGRDV